MILIYGEDSTLEFLKTLELILILKKLDIGLYNKIVNMLNWLVWILINKYNKLN